MVASLLEKGRGYKEEQRKTTTKRESLVQEIEWGRRSTDRRSHTYYTGFNLELMSRVLRLHKKKTGGRAETREGQQENVKVWC
jgi:hypothetical protein